MSGAGTATDAKDSCPKVKGGRAAAALTLGLAALAPPRAGAQLGALPVYSLVSPASPVPKLFLFADYGHGSGAIAGRRLLGGRVLFAPKGRLFASAGAGQLHFDDSRFGSVATVAASAGFALCKLPRFPVALLQAGVGHTAFGDPVTGRVHQVDIPLAAAAGLYAPAPFGTVRLWLAPRAHLRHIASSGPLPRLSVWEGGAGGTVGGSITLHNGLGLQTGYDFLWIAHPLSGGGHFEGSVGLGALWVHGF